MDLVQIATCVMSKAATRQEIGENIRSTADISTKGTNYLHCEVAVRTPPAHSFSAVSSLQLHGVVKDMALRLKTENAPQHARSLLDSDTRLQTE